MKINTDFISKNNTYTIMNCMLPVRNLMEQVGTRL